MFDYARFSFFCKTYFQVRLTHRPLSSSFLGLPYRILNIYHKKELLRSLRVNSVKGPKPKFLETLNPKPKTQEQPRLLRSFRQLVLALSVTLAAVVTYSLQCFFFLRLPFRMLNI